MRKGDGNWTEWLQRDFLSLKFCDLTGKEKMEKYKKLYSTCIKTLFIYLELMYLRLFEITGKYGFSYFPFQPGKMDIKLVQG